MILNFSYSISTVEMMMKVLFSKMMMESYSNTEFVCLQIEKVFTHNLLYGKQCISARAMSKH